MQEPIRLKFYGNHAVFPDLPFNQCGNYTFLEDCTRLDASHRNCESLGMFRAVCRFPWWGSVAMDDCWVRLVFRTENTARFPVMLCAGRTSVMLADDTSVSHGAWVATPPVELPRDLLHNYMSLMQDNNLAFFAQFCDEPIFIKELLFFKTKEDAEAYAPAYPVSAERSATLTVNGNDIENYTIVIPSEPNPIWKALGEKLSDRLRRNYGVSVRVLPDSEPESSCEILVGDTNRAASKRYYDPANGLFPTEALSVLDAVIAVDGAKLVVASQLPHQAYRAMIYFCQGYLDHGFGTLDSNFKLRRRMNCETRFDTVEENMKEPMTYTYNFREDAVMSVPYSWNIQRMDPADPQWGRTSVWDVHQTAEPIDRVCTFTLTPPRGTVSHDYDYIRFEVPDSSYLFFSYGENTVGNTYSVEFLGAPDVMSNLCPELSEKDAPYTLRDIWSRGGTVTLTCISEKPVTLEKIYFYTDLNQVYPKPLSESVWLVNRGHRYEFHTDRPAVSWLHVLERDVDITATFCALDRTGKIGITARHNDMDCTLNAGYDFNENCWYLYERDGADFVSYRRTAAGTFPKEGCTVRLVLKGKTAKLYCDGGCVLTTDTLAHRSPGRVGIFADSTHGYCSEYTVTLCGRESKVIASAMTCALPTQYFVEGGTILRRKNGNLVFMYDNHTQFESTDDGETFHPIHFTDFDQHVNVFRLNSGNLIKLVERDTENGRFYAVCHSADDGETWTEGGNIAPMKFQGVGGSCIMNDRFSQLTDGRIFIGICYNGRPPITPHNRVAWMDFWYSDDEGRTWQNSETKSIDITDMDFFAESMIIETDDGSLRMMTSWCRCETILYSESFDRGVTWGPLKRMEGFNCSVSTFAVRRDLFADRLCYYLIWTYDKAVEKAMPRTHLALARSYDGKTWEYIADVERRESRVNVLDGAINHSLDCFVEVTDKYVFAGVGQSDNLGTNWTLFHHNPREYIVRFDKDDLTAESTWMKLTSHCTYVDRNS